MKLKYFWRLLIAASKLDIFDLAYEFSSESLKAISGGYWMKVNGLPRKGITIRISIFFYHFYKSFIKYWRQRGAVMLPEGFVFIALSKNEIDSLKPVCARMPTAYLTGRNETPFPFPFVWAYALSCAYLPLVVIHFLKAKGYKKKTFGYVFDYYWLSYGLYIAAGMWFRRQRPRAVVLANHLNPYHRVLHKAAGDEHIPTFYLQHASIPDNIAPLQSDYALLEGQDTLNKLAHAGTVSSRIFLIGMPKLDAHLRHINIQAQVRSIGICTNDWDPLLRAEQLLARIRQGFATLPLILRPHNADLRVSAWQDLARRYGIELSDSRTELSFDFLRRVDAIIAGESNILLEAALVNVVPLYYDFAQAHLDWYGFLRHGLVEYLSEPQQVCHCIEEISRSKPSVRAKAKLYCTTIGTRYDGHSGELAAVLIQSLVSGAQVDRSIWKRIPDIGLEAFELADV
jgi:hypothetical protein